MPFTSGSRYEDYEPTPIIQPGPASGLVSQLGDPGPPQLAPPLLTAAPAPGQGLTLTDSSKVPLQTLYRAFLIFPNGATTPSVWGGTNFFTANSGATTITTFLDGREGQRITIVFTDANTTITDGSNLMMAGSITGTANDTIEYVFDGRNWYELGRSVN